MIITIWPTPIFFFVVFEVFKEGAHVFVFPEIAGRIENLFDSAKKGGHWVWYIRQRRVCFFRCAIPKLKSSIAPFLLGKSKSSWVPIFTLQKSYQQTLPHTTALNSVSVCQTEISPPTSFRFRLAANTVAFAQWLVTTALCLICLHGAQKRMQPDGAASFIK